METATMPENTGRIAFRQGAFIGVILGVVQIVLSLLAVYLPIFGNGWLNVALWAGAFLLAGIQASKRTGRLGTGALAGFWTAVIAGVIALVSEILMIMTNLGILSSQIQQGLQQAGITQTISDETIMGMILILFGILFLLGLGWGALFGLFGGLIGRNST